MIPKSSFYVPHPPPNTPRSNPRDFAFIRNFKGLGHTAEGEGENSLQGVRAQTVGAFRYALRPSLLGGVRIPAEPRLCASPPNTPEAQALGILLLRGFFRR